ncbi:L-threonylcarbamoyladenylate synthase [Rhizobium halophytocola]|nr:L-threonylcarbamoyladenylate synthase [Rhizobium halophytocola]
MARILSLSGDWPAARDAALAVLHAARPIALPTETVYGLAADATSAEAVTAIYETKGRPRFNPLICHMSDLAMAERYAVFDPLSRRLAERFWPGPLTLVLPLKDGSGIHPLATAGLDTVGVRVPAGAAARLIAAFDRPLAAPSANTSGGVSPTSAGHVDADLGPRIDLILDGGPSPVGVESTIVKAEPDGRLRLLRPGGVAAEDIEAELASVLIRPEAAGAIIEAPGMLASHYAPNAHIRLNARRVEPGEALLSFGGQGIDGAEKALIALNLSLEGDVRQAAANLFAYMKQADASGARTIAVMPIPDRGLGEAINDRLLRAAAPRQA